MKFSTRINDNARFPAKILAIYAMKGLSIIYTIIINIITEIANRPQKIRNFYPLSYSKKWKTLIIKEHTKYTRLSPIEGLGRANVSSRTFKYLKKTISTTQTLVSQIAKEQPNHCTKSRHQVEDINHEQF